VPSVDELHARILAGNRRALAKAITLLESARADDRQSADALLGKLMAEPRDAVRIGISGPPGVGKSTFIEAFGQKLLADGASLAILAIDPSSPVSGGSILGDRTRMETLSRHERVFIRPSPAGRTLGGVARHTREAIVACEKAGYGIVIVETVGVGQSEFVAASMVDVFLMLHQPNSGDDLQGIKRGILELADLVAITKADGDSLPAAKLAQSQLEQALMTARIPGQWLPPVLLTSALTGNGMDDVKKTLLAFLQQQTTSGAHAARRREQAKRWLHDELGAQLLEALHTDKALAAKLRGIEAEVVAGKLTGNAAARSLIQGLFTRI
jgi:LAO/AO transport system kinase